VLLPVAIVMRPSSASHSTASAAVPADVESLAGSLPSGVVVAAALAAIVAVSAIAVSDAIDAWRRRRVVVLVMRIPP